MNKTLISILCLTAGAAFAAGNYHEREQGKAMIQRLTQEHGLDGERIRRLLADAEHQTRIITAISTPAEKRLTWREYRPIFLQPERIAKGAAFVREHAALFDQVETEYGVPPSIIAAIIGVETRYGGFIGRDRVLDALATLGFDYPPRAEFFLGELEQFLILAEEEKLAANAVLGSYAGAMGMPQFIPSSYRHYAVDFNGNGQRNLWDEPADILASVANYLAEHGWQAGEPVALSANTVAPEKLTLERSRLKTRYRYRELSAQGVTTARPPAAGTEVGLLELEGASGTEFWVGLNNFFVITRYNHSRLYAMAVFQLSEAIQAQIDDNQ